MDQRNELDVVETEMIIVGSDALAVKRYDGDASSVTFSCELMMLAYHE